MMNGDMNVVLPENLKKRSVKELFTVALARPFRFLGTEAIILCAALYNGYLYGLSFLFNTAFALVFGQGHGFDTIGVGICFLGIVCGISLGPVVNIWQERYYQARVHESGGKNVPEARVGPIPKLAAIREYILVSGNLETLMLTGLLQCFLCPYSASLLHRVRAQTLFSPSWRHHSGVSASTL